MSKTISNVMTSAYTLSSGSNPLYITSTGGIETGIQPMTAITGSSAQAWTVQNSGTVSANSPKGGVGVNLAGAGLILNTGSISGYTDGVEIKGVATVSNQGFITSHGEGVTLSAGGLVMNSGVISSATSTGVDISGGPATVLNAGTIASADNGYSIRFRGSFSDLLIDLPGAVFIGEINGGTGINTLELAAAGGGATGIVGTLSGFGTPKFTAFGNVTIDAGASWLFDSTDYVENETNNNVVDNGTLTNGGLINEEVVLTTGASLLNVGMIVPATPSGYASPDALTSYGASSITNMGTVEAERWGVNSDGVFNNATGGEVVAEGVGVRLSGGLADSTNKGLIETTTVAAGNLYGPGQGIHLYHGASFNNLAGGRIVTTYEGAYPGDGSLTNAGTIIGAIGVRLGFEILTSGETIGVLSNLAGGTIIANGSLANFMLGGSAAAAIFSSGGDSTIINDGSVVGMGTADAVQFEGSYAALLVDDPGAVFDGLVVGGTGSNTLQLGKGSGAVGTLGNFGSQFQGFSTLSVAAGATWVLGAGSTIGNGITLVDAGTLASAVGPFYGAVTLAGLDAVLRLEPSASFYGTIAGGNGTLANTLELAAGTLAAVGTLSVPATGFGTERVDAGATWDVAGTLSASTLVNDGTIVVDSGNQLIVSAASLTADASGAHGFVLAQAGTLTLQSSLPRGQGIQFSDGTGLLAIGSIGGFTGTITGLRVGDVIDVLGTVATGYHLSGTTLVLTNGANPVGTLALSEIDAGATFALIADAAGTGTDVTTNAPCFAAGTHIATPNGMVAVEMLQIGDGVITHAGAVQTIRWIGRRSYDGRFLAGKRDVLPILIQAGALADNVPCRDLYVSPKHAMFLSGALIPAELLVNGRSIVQRDAADTLTYFHLELERHDILLAECAPAESFVDCDSRRMFQNAHEFAEMYPDDRSPTWTFCAPRVEDGVVLANVRRRIAARAGLTSDHAKDPAAPGILQGKVDVFDHLTVSGWAFDPVQPHTAVWMALWVDGVHVVDLVANSFRGDLRDAQKGEGRCAFQWRHPTVLASDIPHSVELRRIADGMVLAKTLTADPINPGPIDGYVEVVGPRLVSGWVVDTAWPETPVRLEILDGDHIVGQVHADKYRPDLAAAGKAGGYCHFTFNLRAPTDIAKLRVRRAGDRAVLPRLPMIAAVAA